MPSGNPTTRRRGGAAHLQRELLAPDVRGPSAAAVARVDLVRLLAATAIAWLGLLVWGATTAFATAPLSLEECVRQALEANPSLASREWTTKAAGHALRGAKAERLPRLDHSFDITRSERAQRVAPPSYLGERIYTDRDLVIAETRMRIPIYQGGGLKARVLKSEAVLAGARQVQLAHEQGLILDVVAAFTRAQEQRATIQALTANRDAMRANLTTVKALEEVGRAPHLDALKVEVRLAALQQQASEAERDLVILRTRLARLLGLPAGAPLPDVSPDPVVVQAPTSRENFDAVSAALERRPESRVARARVDEARAEVNVARSQGRPEAHGVVAYSWRSGVPWTNLEEVDRRVAYAWGGVGITVPLWTGGRTGATVAEAEAEKLSAQADLEALLLEIGEQVGQALAALQDARDRAGVSRRAAAQAEEALSIEQSSYEVGRAVVNDVLDAQAALLGAQLDQARADGDVARATAALVYAVGDDLRTAVLDGDGGNLP